MTMAVNVKGYLAGKGVVFDLVMHPVTGSSHATAVAAHVAEDHIAKAVILHDDAGAVMVVLPGNAWVSLSAVRQALNRNLALAEEGDAARHFPDCDIGAIPPLGPAYGMQTLLDESLTTLANVYFESGDHQTLVRVDGPDFLELLAGARRGHFGHQD